MVIIHSINTAVEIQDGCIMTYDMENTEVNISSECKLLSADLNYANKIEKALNIKSVKNYGIEILD